ncbi:Imm32 family immunity protein [Pedobacter sp. WC2501]|uniref:Imm32 family immunity protein n=1 Tax=Pedobacter sp. WC2501 TaxID=3461400 RepID=UPI00404534D4
MMIEVKLEVPKYNDEVGLQSSWVNGFILKTDIIENQIQIQANKAGLISLAKQLLSLAQDETPIGCHYHLDDYDSLEADSIELIISKI